MLLRGVGTLRYLSILSETLLVKCPSVQWQSDGLTIHTKNEIEQFYQVNQMIRGIGDASSSTCSQTLNGQDPVVTWVNFCEVGLCEFEHAYMYTYAYHA